MVSPAVCRPHERGTRLPMSTPTRRHRMGQNRVLRLLDRLEQEPRADAVIDAAGRGVRALPLRGGRDLLHGRWLGTRCTR
ncbi:ferredoxin, 2Fe-2S [Streptomyces sp. F-3]|nr:ferredoxin, 2Fe-2S [Streptomyces sp. F-3]